MPQSHPSCCLLAASSNKQRCFKCTIGQDGAVGDAGLKNAHVGRLYIKICRRGLSVTYDAFVNTWPMSYKRTHNTNLWDCLVCKSSPSSTSLFSSSRHSLYISRAGTHRQSRTQADLLSLHSPCDFHCEHPEVICSFNLHCQCQNSDFFFHKEDAYILVIRQT